MRRSGGKKPIYKRPWLWVLVVLVLFGFAGMGGQKEEPAQAEGSAVTRAMPAEEAPAEQPQEDPAPEPEPEPEPAQAAPAAAPAPAVHDYVLNTNTMKFHVPTCGSVSDMNADNRQDFTGTREDVIAQGYEPCGRCHP